MYGFYILWKNYNFALNTTNEYLEKRILQQQLQIMESLILGKSDNYKSASHWFLQVNQTIYTTSTNKIQAIVIQEKLMNTYSGKNCFRKLSAH